MRQLRRSNKRLKSTKTEQKEIVEEHPIIPKPKSSKTEDKAIEEEQHEAKSSKTKGKVVVEEQHKAKSSETEDKTGVEEQNKAMEESVRTIKLVWGEDISCAQMPANCGVSQLREIARDRFPSLKAVPIKYKDQEGDLVTITTTEELRWAEASVNLQGSLRVFIAEVNPERDPLFSHQSKNGNPVQKHMIRGQNNGSPFIDDWIIEFVQLLKNQVGLILMEKFQEMAALAFFHWGNVHMSRARKRVPLTEDASTELVVDQVRKAYEWAQRVYEEAGKKYNEALHIKSDFYEGLLALGQQRSLSKRNLPGISQLPAR
ncbi:hypothetical protein MRB53_017941 [Persea americana]|uniref:Uncharacterized protein n=1 Tax=Persea americana TaxID=3435 RepID=A0ACC2M623_PERAE|nr:hypothetical protein MRB53_017941 [Persea americana]